MTASPITLDTMPSQPTEEAIESCRQLINKSTTDLDQMAGHLETLRRLFMEQRQLDKAWCVAAAASFLGKADAEGQRFHDQHRPQMFTRARARMTEELWRLVYHADEDRHVSAVFALVSYAVAAARAREHKAWGLKRKERRDIAKDVLLFSKVFNYVSQVLGVPTPEVYMRPGSPGEMDLANACEKSQLVPSLVVFSGLLQGRPDKELAYVIAKGLTFMRPDHFVRWPHVVPTIAELKIIFVAAVKLVHRAFVLPADIAQPVGQYVDHLQRSLAPQQIQPLSAVVQSFLAAGRDADIHKWANAVEMTATRMGFLICNDLEVAAKIVNAEPASVGVADAPEKMWDLILWSISDAYFTLRERLGLRIGEGS